MRFTEKICVVTGGASGIGRATCRRLATEGGSVVVVDVDEDAGRPLADTLIGAGKQAIFMKADVAQPLQVRAVIDHIIERWRRIDIMVNCAAKMTFKPVVDLEDEEWDNVLFTNLRSVFLFCKYGLPHMTQGAIVNVSSVHAFRTTVNVAPYAASKGGIEAFTRVLSLESQERNVRVNSIAPGAVDTPMLWSNPLVKNGKEKIEGRIGEPEHVAAAIAFLASDESAFITGTTLVVDGGRLSML